MSESFDLIVIGAGHAGCEAAAVAARLGRNVALITLNLAQIARLSCNPAVGGLAKGNLVREIDALGGLMGHVADATCIQFRRLNTRKGLAVQASRAQVDIDEYPREMQRRLREIDGLTLIEGEVTAIHTEDGKITGVQVDDGTDYTCPKVILTAGTFLAGLLHCGEEKTVGGRVGDGAAHKLSDSLREIGIRLGRLKTGTTPRLDARTIHWDRLETQDDTIPEGRFSFSKPKSRMRQITCHMTYTNAGIHEKIRSAIHRSPLYNGTIQGTGPRYCPSIEDKVVRFPERNRHVIFLEPEGLNTHRVYVNGLSTSLPKDIQDTMVAAVPGLEDAVIIQYGYAVEYDYADPTDLGPDLQHKAIVGLFMAGQVNGTSGYEEAAAQGLVAGISAAQDRVFHVERSEGYIGVLIDDLVTRGVGGEPYRMFTSRAEHRLLLREDNADRRLMPRGRELGLIDDEVWHDFQAKLQDIKRGQDVLSAAKIFPNPATLARLKAAELGGLKGPATGEEMLRRPACTWQKLGELIDLPDISMAAAEQIEIDIKYAGYVARATRRAESAQKMDAVKLPQNVDWRAVDTLSWEVRDRLNAAKPSTLGQVGRIPGITPAAVNAVATWLTKRRAAARE